MFVYGGARLLTNDFVDNAAGGGFLYPDVYICDDVAACRAHTPKTLDYYDVEYDPFPSHEGNRPVYAADPGGSRGGGEG